MNRLQQMMAKAIWNTETDKHTAMQLAAGISGEPAAWESKLVDETGFVHRVKLDEHRYGPMTGNFGVDGWAWKSRLLVYADTEKA